MPRLIRCACGLAVQVGEDYSPYGGDCPMCGQPLPLDSSSPPPPGRALARDAATKGAATETVQLKPFYALEEKPSFGFKVVEVVDPAGEDLNPEAGQTYSLEKEPAKPRWADTDREDVNYILAKARHELRRQRQNQPRLKPLEKTGWECLLYPYDVCWQLLPLAFLLAFTMLMLVTVSAGSDLPAVIILGALLVQIGVTWSFLRQVMRLAVAGERNRIPIAVFFRDPGTTARASLMAGVTFLAGPAFLLAGAVWFWIHAGTLEWFDHLLLWNLWLAAGVGWVYLLLAVDHRDRLRDAHAKAVARLIRGQGWPAMVFPLVAGVSVTIFVYLSAATWISLFDSGLLAFISQFLLWSIGLFFWTFWLRWYGLTRYWRRNPASGRSDG
jgi:hypothetical protein